MKIVIPESIKRVRPIYWWALGGAAAITLVSFNLSRFSRGAKLLLTANTLRKAMPGLPLSRLTEVLPHLTDALDTATVNTPLRISAFLAQTGAESGDFRYMEELASGEAYEGRSDLGNTQPGDGVRFKGRGPIQLTGRANYAAFSKAMGKGDLFVRQPELVATYEWGFRASAWFWNMRNLNKWADRGEFNAVTYRVNGGCRGSQERWRRYRAAKAALGIANAPEVQEFKDGRGNTRTCCPVGTTDGRVGTPGCVDSVA